MSISGGICRQTFDVEGNFRVPGACPDSRFLLGSWRVRQPAGRSLQARWFVGCGLWAWWLVGAGCRHGGLQGAACGYGGLWGATCGWIAIVLLLLTSSSAGTVPWSCDHRDRLQSPGLCSLSANHEAGVETTAAVWGQRGSSASRLLLGNLEPDHLHPLRDGSSPPSGHDGVAVRGLDDDKGNTSLRLSPRVQKDTASPVSQLVPHVQLCHPGKWVRRAEGCGGVPATCQSWKWLSGGRKHRQDGAVLSGR